ncbi:MAG: hypothetical protein OHK005_14920 [Candidatus Methylacidiphilales bacterium]
MGFCGVHQRSKRGKIPGKGMGPAGGVGRITWAEASAQGKTQGKTNRKQ